MNWVGGARSRVRQQADRKLQKEFFERKRLEAKVKKTRPRSPQDGTRKGISRDLLTLQAVSRLHDNWNDDRNRPPPHVRKVKLTGPRANWPERNLALPMSPIGNPSALAFHETSYDGGAHLHSLYTSAPKVSTQKYPRHTVLDSFEPAPQWKRGRNGGISNEPSKTNSVWTESVFPNYHKYPSRAAPHNLHQATGAQSGDPLLMTESVVPERAGRARNQRGKRHTMFGTYVDLAKAESRKKRSVAEKSYDHETPFNFEFHAPKEAGASNRYELPRTKASLLDFHSSENPTRPERPQTRENKLREGVSHAPTLTQPHNTDVGTADTALPTGTAPEPQGDTVKEERALPKERNFTSNSHNKSSTGFSSLFDEDPLSNKSLGRPTPSTVFCESILGPLHRKRRLHPTETSSPEAKQRLRSEDRASVGGLRSAFEEMMSKFDVNPVSRERECGIGLGYVEEQKGREGGGAKFDGENSHVGLGQHREWQQFISGACGEPGQGKLRETACHVQWQHFVSGTSTDSAENKNEFKNSQTSQDERSKLQIPVSKAGCSATTSDKQPRRRLGNISVMDELMCLEEIGSSMDTDALASQEVSFTPNVSCTQQVPDVDSDFGNLTENPLNIGHTPYQLRRSTQSVYYRDHPNTTVDKEESMCDSDPSQSEPALVCSVAPQESVSEQTSVEPQKRAPSTMEIQESAQAHDPMGDEGEEQGVPHIWETVEVACGSDEVSIPVKAQCNDLRLQPPPSTSVATQTELEGDPAQNDAKKAATLSTAVQCSTGLEQTYQDTATPVHRSIQTDDIGRIYVHQTQQEEKGVQVTIHVDAAEMRSGPEDGTSHAVLSSVDDSSSGVQLVSAVKRSSSLILEDEEVNLREELKNTQNTIIWQSLMLRLYAMH